MRTEEHRAVRLEDYRPPDWLIDTVDLDVSLDPSATRVRATLKLRPNPAAAPAPLVLDGDELRLVSVALDGKPLPAENFVATPERLTIPFEAITAFADPAVKFGLQFQPTAADSPVPDAAAPAAPEKVDKPGEVVALDAFRKK